jgi:hypothetical protein
VTNRRQKKHKKRQKPYQEVWRDTELPPATRPRNEKLISELHAASDKYLDESGLTLQRLDFAGATESIVFGQRNLPMVYVFAEKAATAHGTHRTIMGNFRAAGPHWGTLRMLLLELQGGQVEAPKSQVVMDKSLDTFPPSLSPLLASKALAASRLIRSDRARAFSCPVVLEGTMHRIRFEPIQVHPSLIVPFNVRANDGSQVQAVLDLASTSDPIAVAFQATVDESLVVEAWPIVLLAFADLVCDESLAPAKPAPRAPSSEHRLGLQKVDPPRTVLGRGGGRGRRWSAALEPIGDTARHRGSFVAGHRRRLRPGQRCAETARVGARAHGIDLADSWTWVQPHERGVPAGFVQHFAWRMPSGLGA